MSASSDEHVARADFGIRLTRAPEKVGCLSGGLDADDAVASVVVVAAGAVSWPVAGVEAVTAAGVVAPVLLLVVPALDPLWIVGVDDDDEAPGGLGGWLEPGHRAVLGP